MTNNQLSTQQAKRDIAIDTSVWTFQDVKRYFDPQNLLTEKQVGQALSLIKGRNLNPLANEVYIVAYKKKTGQKRLFLREQLKIQTMRDLRQV